MPVQFADQIEKVQHDALLLLEFLSGRKERAFFSDAGAATGIDALIKNIQEPAADLAKDSARFGALLQAVDKMASLASPATVDSIRFTREYIARSGGGGGGGPPNQPPGAAGGGGGRGPTNGKEVGRLRLFYIVVGVAAALAVALTVMLLNQSLRGQMILEKLASLDEGRTAVYADYAKQTSADGTLLSLDQFCQKTSEPPQQSVGAPCTGGAATGTPGGQTRAPEPTPAAPAAPPPAISTDPAGARNAARLALLSLCGVKSDLERKLDLTYLQLSDWNITTDRMYHPFPVPNWIRPDAEDLIQQEARRRFGNPERQEGERSLLTAAWNSTELRAQTMLASMMLYWAPAQLGFIGAVVYLFRRLHSHLQDFTLDPRELILASTRVALGIMLGGLAPLLFQADANGATEYSLSLGLLAFLTGFSVQVVFDRLDALWATPKT